MAIIPETYQDKLDDYVLQQDMRYETLSVIHKMNVTKKVMKVLQDLNQPTSFDILI